jgi:UDP-galactopyranose mutase
MPLLADYVVVGSGLTGATIARLLADAGREVLVLERRSHVGGNVHDHLHPSGIRVHTYGPHYFRTNSKEIWDFVHRFARFYPYHAVVKSRVDGRLESWPVTEEYIRQVVGVGWTPEFRGRPRNFEEACLRMMPRVVYEKFVKGYTEKQWGVPATVLSPNLAGRFEVRRNGDERLKLHRFQGIPSGGYAFFMRRMLEGIPVILNFDYIQRRDEVRARRLLIFTGPIDEFFNFDLGKLRYRAQHREHRYVPDSEYVLPVGQVNYPSLADGPQIRALEWKHMMEAPEAQAARGTLVTTETPYDPSDPDHYEYPFPDESNQKLYRAYAGRAAAMPSVLICGRLGEYRYYDMDQAIARAMTLVRRILVQD